MLRNYIISSLRTLSRNKIFSILNITGLAIGLASAILILQYVTYERSYDTFHSNAEDIYRIQYNNYQNGQLTFECAAAVPAAGPAMANNFPEVISFVRMLPFGGVMSYESPERGLLSFREKNMQAVDASIFDVFDFNLIEGNESTCLDSPDKLIISESVAKKYFGTENPINKRITMDGERVFTVSGLFEDVPDNSHIKFGFLASNTVFSEFFEGWEDSWGWYDHNTYVKVRPGTNVNQLQSNWDEYLAETLGPDWERNNSKQEFILQPLTSIHLNSNLLQESEPEEQGDAASVRFLFIISIFILIIAWVNYVNLATAKSMERANEVGVRKVMGAEKKQLRNQFLIESILINLVAGLVAALIILVSWTAFTNLTGRNIPFTLFQEPRFWWTVLIIILSGSLLAGLYPALVLSSFQPVRVLKGKINVSKTGGWIRQGLVVFQFMASVVLIIGAIVAFQQLSFMKSQDLGFDMNRTLVVEGPGITDSTYEQTLESFKNTLTTSTSITSVTAATNVPGNEIIWTRGIRRLSGGPESSITIYNAGIDEDYLPTFNLQLIAGRNFSKDISNESDRVLLNRALADALEYTNPEDAIGEFVNLGGDTVEIAGVIENYHQMSLKNKPSPMVFLKIPGNSFYAIKLNSENYEETLDYVEDEFATFFPDNPFDYFYLDQFFNRQYDQEKRFGQTFGIFTFLAIVIACLGLFGLASYLTSRRTKEIGIRKVLGSSMPSILKKLTIDFMKPVLIAILLGFPVAWFIMNEWLSNFPYHIELNILMFLSAGITVLLVAVLSVAYQTIKTASTNPADTLRYE